MRTAGAKLGRWGCLLGWTLLAGCGEPSLPQRAKATGVVTYRDAPLAKALVTFHPEDGRVATAETDALGGFTLGTFDLNDGALLGRHRVSVVARGPERPMRPGEVGSGLPGEMFPGDPLIPTKYFAPESSGLEFEVKKGDMNHFELKLTD